MLRPFPVRYKLTDYLVAEIYPERLLNTVKQTVPHRPPTDLTPDPCAPTDRPTDRPTYMHMYLYLYLHMCLYSTCLYTQSRALIKKACR